MNKRKLDILKDEITRYKNEAFSLHLENIDLKNTIRELNDKNQEKQEFIDGMQQELEALKTEHDECIEELREYKKNYIKLLKDLSSMRKHYKKEFKMLMGNMKRNQK